MKIIKSVIGGGWHHLSKNIKNQSMKNLRIIFRIIRKYSVKTGVFNWEHFPDLEKVRPSNSLFFPLHVYLKVLQSLGLIKFSTFEKQIVLMGKGKTADELSMLGIRIFIVLLLRCIAWIFFVMILLILFWPSHLTVRKQPVAQKKPKEQNA
jgi:hypothetical protein